MRQAVTLAPIASAFTDRVPRRTMLVTLDLVRAVVAMALPFVSEVWRPGFGQPPSRKR